MYIYNEEKIARKKILQKFFEFQAKATRSWAEVPFELMIIICKEPRTDLGQKGGKSSDFNDDALSGSHENIWRMIKQRSHHYNKRAAINQSIVSTQPNNQNKFLLSNSRTTVRRIFNLLQNF